MSRVLLKHFLFFHKLKVVLLRSYQNVPCDFKQVVGGSRHDMPPPLYAPHAAVQIQHMPIACGAQRALLPVAVGAMNIHDVRDGRQTASLLNAPT